MPFTPVENFRKCVIASPPWVIFTISLGIMAFGVLILACRLRSDSYEIQPFVATAQYCVMNGKDNAENSTNATSAILSISVAITMRMAFLNEIINSSQSGGGLEWTGMLHDGQLGLKSAVPNATFPLQLLLTPTPPYSCADEVCGYVLIQTCALVHGVMEEHKTPNTVLETNAGASTCNSFKTTADSAHLKSALINRLDTNYPVDQNLFSLIGNRDKWCENGTMIGVQRRDARGFVLIPLLHDTLTARLHLLYTSYFLFTTILILIVYATCRKASHLKPAVRTQESIYSKLSNERE